MRWVASEASTGLRSILGAVLNTMLIHRFRVWRSEGDSGGSIEHRNVLSECSMCSRCVTIKYIKPQGGKTMWLTQVWTVTPRHDHGT